MSKKQLKQDKQNIKFVFVVVLEISAPESFQIPRPRVSLQLWIWPLPEWFPCVVISRPWSVYFPDIIAVGGRGKSIFLAGFPHRSSFGGVRPAARIVRPHLPVEQFVSVHLRELLELRRVRRSGACTAGPKERSDFFTRWCRVCEFSMSEGHTKCE